MERLPSGKFSTNALIIALGAFAYNILRFIGQTGLLVINHPSGTGQKTPYQDSCSRVDVRLRLRLSKHCAAYDAFAKVLANLAET